MGCTIIDAVVLEKCETDACARVLLSSMLFSPWSSFDVIDGTVLVDRGWKGMCVPRACSFCWTCILYFSFVEGDGMHHHWRFFLENVKQTSVHVCCCSRCPFSPRIKCRCHWCYDMILLLFWPWMAHSINGERRVCAPHACCFFPFLRWPWKLHLLTINVKRRLRACLPKHACYLFVFSFLRCFWIWWCHWLKLLLLFWPWMVCLCAKMRVAFLSFFFVFVFYFAGRGKRGHGDGLHDRWGLERVARRQQRPVGGGRVSYPKSRTIPHTTRSHGTHPPRPGLPTFGFYFL